MTHPRSITTNLKFVYADQKKKLHGMLRYFQYRQDKAGESHLPQRDADGRRVERWVDRGLGTYHREILENCLDLATDTLKRDVGARLMVVAPEVNLMHAIPAERRTDVLRELTEATLDGWFEKLDLPTPPFSYVLHESESADTRPDGRPKDEPQTQSYLHAHVILAPTVPGIERERELYKVYERQIGVLHEAGREALEHIWVRELGQERYDELQAELIARDARQRDLDRQHHQYELEAAFPYIGVESAQVSLPVQEHEMEATLPYIGAESAQVSPPPQERDFGLEL